MSIMPLTTRRHFLRQTAAAALYGCPFTALNELARSATASQQNAIPVDAAALRKLSSNIAGSVITSDASEYDAARLIFNRAFDLRPAVIVRCAGPSDVARALEFSQTQKVPLAVRGGGHSRLGHGMCDGGVVIDLSGMKRIEVDGGKRLARVGAGALVRDLDEATQ